MHILGFYDEHNREDRDEYIDINWNNIKETDYIKYQRVKLNNELDSYLGLPYDHQSVTHMSSFSSEAINPLLPIMTLNNYYLFISMQNYLSLGDIAKINRKYVCKDNRYKKYDKGDIIENAIPWDKFLKLK